MSRAASGAVLTDSPQIVAGPPPPQPSPVEGEGASFLAGREEERGFIPPCGGRGWGYGLDHRVTRNAARGSVAHHADAASWRRVAWARNSRASARSRNQRMKWDPIPITRK